MYVCLGIGAVTYRCLRGAICRRRGRAGSRIRPFVGAGRFFMRRCLGGRRNFHVRRARRFWFRAWVTFNLVGQRGLLLFKRRAQVEGCREAGWVGGRSNLVALHLVHLLYV